MKKKTLTIILFALIASIAILMACSAQTAAEPASDQPADYPEIVSITPDSAGFVINWTAYPGAAKYRLFVRGASGWMRVGDTASTTLRHHGLSDQTTYTYTVRALDSKGAYMSTYLVSGWSNTFRAAPQLTSVAASGSAMKITWNAIPDAGCYRVYRKSGSSWVGLGFTEDTFFMDHNVTSGGTYTYTVRSFDADRRTTTSAFQSPGKSGTYVSMPSIHTAEARNSGLRLTWNRVAGAQQYRVFIKNGSGWKGIGTTSANYFDYRYAPVGTASTYTVRAIDAYGRYTSDFSRKGITHTTLSAPKMISVTNLTRGQMISWEKVAGAERYRVYKKNGSIWQKVGDTSSFIYTVSDVQNNTSYTYTVRCLSKDGKVFCSGFNSSGMTTRYYQAPEVTGIENLSAGARLKWNRIPGVAAYRVFVRENGTWKKLADVSDTFYTHTSAVQGVTYTYTVRALDSYKRYISTYYGSGWNNLYQTAPLLRNVMRGENGTALDWTAFKDAGRYRVYRRYIDTSWSRIADVDGLSYTDTAAQKGRPCQYTLRTIDSKGNTTSDFFESNIYYVDGKLCDGQLNVNGYLVTFNKGKITKGYLTPQQIIKIAQAEVGTRATNYKRCKYNTWYYGADVSGDYYDWCVVFVEWVFNQAGARDLLFDKTAGAEFFGQGFYQHGQLVKSGYRVGDLLLLHWKEGWSSYVPGVKLLNHVGIIIAVNDDGSYTTIEGNTGDSENGEVMIKRRYPDFISCACRPKYGFYIPAK